MFKDVGEAESATKDPAAFHFVEDVGMPFGVLGRLLGVLGQRTAEKMVEAMLRRLETLCETPT
jgi:hypothetical protein